MTEPRKLKLLVSNPDVKKISNKTKGDRIAEIRQHLRVIESNMAHVNQKAKDIDWSELSDMIDDIHHGLCQALKLSKTRDKGFLEEVKKTKPKLTVLELGE